MRFKKITKMFQNGNVCVVGLRGTGKDVLFGNVIARRKIPYVSNTDYGGNYMPFRADLLDCGGNTYRDFINATCKAYDFPYCDGTDVYLADVGVYYPSQYCNELNRDYKNIPVYMALSRHLGESNFHINVQNLNRAWDKLREQSDTYIDCQWCRVFSRGPFKKRPIVVQKIIIYEKYQSCVDRVKPLKLSIPLFGNRVAVQSIKMAKLNYAASHGRIKSAVLIYRNKSKHDTRIFKRLLASRLS